MQTLAVGVGAAIMAFGAFGVLVPSGLVWIATRVMSSGAFYVIAVVRVAFGFLLISVASASRAPKTIRVLGYLVVIAGVTTALMGLLAMDRARAIVEWWLQQGALVVRVTAVLVMAIGGFLTYACAPARRAATS